MGNSIRWTPKNGFENLKVIWTFVKIFIDRFKNPFFSKGFMNRKLTSSSNIQNELLCVSVPLHYFLFCKKYYGTKKLSKCVLALINFSYMRSLECIFRLERNKMVHKLWNPPRNVIHMLFYCAVEKLMMHSSDEIFKFLSNEKH